MEYLEELLEKSLKIILDDSLEKILEESLKRILEKFQRNFQMIVPGAISECISEIIPEVTLARIYGKIPKGNLDDIAAVYPRGIAEVSCC